MTKKRTSILLTILIALAMSFWGCQNEKMPVENGSNVSNLNLNKTHNNIESVVLSLYAFSINKGTSSEPINIEVYKLRQSWDEAFVTWLKRTSDEIWYQPGGRYFEPTDPSFIPKVAINSTGPVEVDITSLWNDGTPLNGIIIKADKLYEDSKRYVVFASRESTSRPTPQVKITYKDGTTTILPVIADAYIWDGDETPNGANISPNTRYPYLYAGVYSSREKRSVLKFNEDCTYCFGYWRIHANPDTKRYNDTWDELDNGPETPFFNSGMTYLEILWKAPKGDEYVLLAHQYIAAELNQLKGASIPSEVKDAFDSATELLSGAQTAERTEWMALTSLLDDYNSGLIGPGYCCDDHESGPKSKDKKHKKWHKKDKKWKPRP